MAELAHPLATFLREYLPRDRGTSRHTVASYALCFKLLVVFAADKHGIRPCTLEIGHLDIATLLEFLEHLERDRGNGVRTRNARLAAIKAFFRFLEFRHPGHLDLAAQVREIPAKKGDVPLIGSLDRAETRALLDAPDPGSPSPEQSGQITGRSHERKRETTATLDSGWWPALTGQGSHLLGRIEGFRQVYPSTWLRRVGHWRAHP